MSALMKLVIYPEVSEERLAEIQEVAGDLSVVNVSDEATAVLEIVDAEAFFGKITPTILAAAKQLQWVQCPTASLEHYIFPELVEHPCTLTNMRGLYGDVIADHVFGFILCFARNLHKYVRQQMATRWAPIGGPNPSQVFITGPGTVSDADRAHVHLSDCTLGIVGLGSIGSEVARRGLAFGMRVLAVDAIQEKAPEGVEALWRPDRLNDLLAEGDFIVIAAPHTPETEGLFRREQFQCMKNTAFLINIGRGAIVRLNDLCDALNAGEIAGAGLDVAEIEPLPNDHPLWKMENVIITPHVAANSIHIAERHLAVLLENVRRFVGGEPLQNVVNKQRWF